MKSEMEFVLKKDELCISCFSDKLVFAKVTKQVSNKLIELDENS